MILACVLSSILEPDRMLRQIVLHQFHQVDSTSLETDLLLVHDIQYVLIHAGSTGADSCAASTSPNNDGTSR